MVAHSTIDHTGLTGVGSPSFVGCKVYNNTTQSLAASTLTYMAFNAEETDTSAFHDNVTNNSRFVAPTTGKYLVKCLLWFATTSGVNYILIDKNHAGAYVRGGVTAASGVGSSAFVSLEITLTAGDYLEAVGYHTQTGSIAVGDTGGTPSQQNIFEMSYLGA